ncbi:DUF2512 family protein [Bacillus piscicola]|uniref:DUF2512 family protein n=1 Tax=Bacillus piscicola TaxID=1632684 RepID=UPI001F098F55|nr:DUF2512 family protein [Bacillus piscicola]
MEHVKALLFKGVMTFFALWLILTVGFGVTVGNVLILTVIIGAISYPFDLFILPRILNFPATVTDFVVSLFIIWLFGLAFFTPDIPTIYASLLVALVLAFGEYYFHTYLATHLLPSNNRLRMDTQ